MKNKYVQLLAATVISLCSLSVWADSSVWKVTKGKDHIYIGGTVHILPPSQFPLPKEFSLAYNNSDAVVLETVLPEPNNAQFQAQMMRALSYKDQQSLTKVLSNETYQALAAYLGEFGVNLNELNKFKPGFIVTMMAMMEARRAQISGQGVDAYFNQLAQRDNKTPEYLESMEFQLTMLANMGQGDEESLIKSTLSQMSDFKDMFSQLISAWRIGDVATLNDVAIKPMQQQDPKTFQSLIVDRNHDWLPKIEKMFSDQDKEFVLVGVAHLVGQDNVLELLTKKGYQVEPL